MIAKTIVVINLIFILLYANSSATIFNYNVTGQFDVDTTTQYVSGNMKISDEFLSENWYGSLKKYYFDIVDFNLTISGIYTPYSFSGDSGYLANYHMITDPVTGEQYYERQWQLSNSSSDIWDNSHDPAMIFFTSEMVEYRPTSTEYWGILATTISLYGPSYATQYPNALDIGGGQIWLTRDLQPVPESSSIVLLIFGFFFLFISNKRKAIHSAIFSNSPLAVNRTL